MRSPLPVLALLAAAWASSPTHAAAQDLATDQVASYAVVVGSNAGGPGQQDLQFAERDAKRMAAVLRELGGYPAKQVTTVLAPTPDALLAAIDGLAETIAADTAAGRRTVIFFYYSGHARATALVLGDQEVALTALRERITALPATVTIVVLDACQSGAFTRIKGAEPAADFSFNSRTGLDAAGLAVMASSSESELSQESDFLEGSYFTHHLLVGLRGGGDRDRDGQVSLDEAYQYAYDQTLVATAHTAVGSQHVSFEADLRGQGEVPLTYPEKADATITIPGEVAGDVLVQRLPAEAVLAEVHKVAGASFDVAIPAGKYRVLIRTAEVIRRCPATVAPGKTVTVDLSGCDDLALVDTTAKLGGEAPRPPLENPWSFELGVGLAGANDDDFTRNLETFGFQRDFMSLRGVISGEAQLRVLPFVSLFGRLTRIESETWSRGTESEPMEFSVTSHAVTGGGRAELRSPGQHVVLWGEAGLGVTWARDRFENEMDEVDHQNFLGPHLSAAAGLTLYTPWHGVGFDLDARWLYAPTVKNLIGDKMDVGGLFFGLGVVYRP